MASNDVVRGKKVLVRHPGTYAKAKKAFPDTKPLQVGPKRHDEAIDRLLSDAAATLPVFTRLFESWKTKGASTATHGDKQAPATSMGPLKKKERVLEKCEADYKSEANPAGACIDIVRATLAYDSPGAILKALDQIVQGEQAGGYGYRIAQAKQLFDMGKDADPLFSLYGDIKLSFLIYAPGIVDGHVCELQFNTVALIAAKAAKDGHHQYEWEREAINRWNLEYAGSDGQPTCSFKFTQIVYDYMNWSAEPSTTEYDWYTQGKSKKYTVKKWYDDFYQSYIASANNTGPARSDFNKNSDSKILIDYVNEMKEEVATRWSNKFLQGQDWDLIKAKIP